jgi:hypothetical protein
MKDPDRLRERIEELSAERDGCAGAVARDRLSCRIEELLWVLEAEAVIETE